MRKRSQHWKCDRLQLKGILGFSAFLAGIVLIGFAASCQQGKKQEPIEPSGGVVGCDKLFDNTNNQAVQNGAANPHFTLAATDPSELCRLYTYHWNNGAGKAPGTIGLINRTTGVTYGPYNAVGSPGQNGVKDVNWTVDLNPRIELKPGNYEIVDSDNPSWSWNAASVDKGWPGRPPGPAGFAQVWTANAQ